MSLQQFGIPSQFGHSQKNLIGLNQNIPSDATASVNNEFGHSSKSLPSNIQSQIPCKPNVIMPPVNLSKESVISQPRSTNPSGEIQASHNPEVASNLLTLLSQLMSSQGNVH